MRGRSTSNGIIIFGGVQKTYDGETLVVKDLNLEIHRGEFLTLLGPSGSGKTTVLMMVAGFEAPTKGEIYLNGAPLKNVPSYKRGIGMVFQDYALFPHMTVAENLAFPLEARKIGKAEIEQKINRVLDMVRLPGYQTRFPSQLSGGQRQRVAVARALVFEPDVVLMDEPLGALDKNLREEMQYEIKHIHDHVGVTVVYVTHDQSEALTMSNRIAVFNEGIIQQLDSPGALYEQPANTFVAQFIGENNRLYGQVKVVDGEFCTVELEHGGETVKALKVNTDLDQRTTLSVRPERVIINPGGGEVDNVFPGKIEELIYLGDNIRARLTVLGNSQFVVKIPNSHRATIPKEGQEVSVGWTSKDCRALDA